MGSTETYGFDGRRSRTSHASIAANDPGAGLGAPSKRTARTAGSARRARTTAETGSVPSAAVSIIVRQGASAIGSTA